MERASLVRRGSAGDYWHRSHGKIMACLARRGNPPVVVGEAVYLCLKL